MITRFIIMLMIVSARVKADCTIEQNDKQGGRIHDRIKKWSIYNKNFTSQSNDSTTYRIGICKDLSDRNQTKIGIIQNDDSKTYHLGRIDRVRLVEGASWILLSYENGEAFENVCENQTRSASIMFVCGKNTNSPKILQQHTNKEAVCYYMFELEVSELCVDTPIEKKGLSGGAIFLIILLSVASAYLIGGFLFMRIKRGARGIDQIPNLDMWRQLGHLAADGCDYCCRCNTTSQRAGYFLDESGPDLRGGDDDILSP